MGHHRWLRWRCVTLSFIVVDYFKVVNGATSKLCLCVLSSLVLFSFLSVWGSGLIRSMKDWIFLPARRRPQGLVVIGVCLSVCLCALFLSARYLKNGFMDRHQIWWVGAGGEPLEQVQFWCWSDSGCVSRITFPFPLTLRDRAFCDI